MVRVRTLALVLGLWALGSSGSAVGSEFGAAVQASVSGTIVLTATGDPRLPDLHARADLGISSVGGAQSAAGLPGAGGRGALPIKVETRSTQTARYTDDQGTRRACRTPRPAVDERAGRITFRPSGRSSVVATLTLSAPRLDRCPIPHRTLPPMRTRIARSVFPLSFLSAAPPACMDRGPGRAQGGHPARHPLAARRGHLDARGAAAPALRERKRGPASLDCKLGGGVSRVRQSWAADRSYRPTSIELTYDTQGHLMPDAFDGFGQALDALGRMGAGGTATEGREDFPEELRGHRSRYCRGPEVLRQRRSPDFQGFRRRAREDSNL